MRRMNMYRDEVERVSGWETSRMRMATETTTKGGGGRVVLQQRRQRQNNRRGKTRRCRQQPRQPTITNSSPPDGFELGTNVGKKLGFFDGEVLGTTLGVADVITLGIDEPHLYKHDALPILCLYKCPLRGVFDLTENN